MKRKVNVDKNKLYRIMRDRSCRLTVREIAEGTNWNYDTLRHGLADGLIMPDTLQDIAKYLDVSVAELQ